MPPDANPPPVPPRVSQRIAELWQRHLPQTRERLDLLQAAASAAQAGRLDAALAQEAAGIAHKLAGSLGMFGFREGSRLAGALELAFEAAEVQPLLLLELTTQLRASVLPDGNG